MTWLSRSVAIVAVSILQCGLVAASDLTGSTVTYQFFSPTDKTPLTQVVSATIGSDIEFPDGSIPLAAPGGDYLTGLSIDIGPNYILEEYTQSSYYAPGVYGAIGNFNGSVYQFGPSSPRIKQIIIDPASTFLLSYDSLLYTYQNLVALDRTEVHLQKGDFLKLNLTFVDDAITTPEPSSVALFLCGLGLVVLKKRRAR